MSSKVLSDAILEQLEQLESVPEYDSSDSGSESVCGRHSSCEMECQVSSLGIDDEQCGECPEQKACEDARCRLDLRWSLSRKKLWVFRRNERGRCGDGCRRCFGGIGFVRRVVRPRPGMH